MAVLCKDGLIKLERRRLIAAARGGPVRGKRLGNQLLRCGEVIDLLAYGLQVSLPPGVGRVGGGQPQGVMSRLAW